MRRVPVFIYGAILARTLIFLLVFFANIRNMTFKRQYNINLDP